MILKSYIVEQNVGILQNYQSTLAYGLNSGIIDEVKSKLKENNKDAELINFFESELIKDKGTLYKNIINESLFNKKKIIFIQEATDKIFNEIIECLEIKNDDIKIYIFCENLDKKSKLRNFFEKTGNLAIFACYEDNEKTLINYISRELKNFKGVTGEIINLIITNSELNRKIIQNELEKIKGFFVEQKINKEQVLEILNIRNSTDFSQIRDSALAGDKKKIKKLLSEIEILSEDVFFYLNNLNYRIVKLISALEIDKKQNNLEQTMSILKPPVFWKDKPSFLIQLKLWDLKKLNRVVLQIYEIEVLIKKNSHLRKDILFKDLIINLSNEASSM